MDRPVRSACFIAVAPDRITVLPFHRGTAFLKKTCLHGRLGVVDPFAAKRRDQASDRRLHGHAASQYNYPNQFIRNGIWIIKET